VTAAADDDAGAVTIWLVGFAGLVALTLVAAMLVAAASAARQRAEAAADLSALAAAAAALRGADPCPTAATVAAADGARLVSCSLDGEARVTVSTAVPLPPALRRLGVGAATAVARAGPVTD
jgi:secretion/DNA translocation related TadE-like protein